MGDTETQELRDNVQAWVSHLSSNVPPDIGAIVIFINKHTGDVQAGATPLPHTAVLEVLRSLVSKLGGGSENLIIPATRMPS